jgi:antitoxin component of RelBE/YafQ-DinJ toxin-antitoxin module
VDTKKIKRISFLIDENTHTLLQKRCQKLGIDQSKLIREWLTNKKNIKLNYLNQYSASLSLFNLRIDSQTLSEVDSRANSSGLSRSDYLRLVISNNLQLVSDNHADTPLNMLIEGSLNRFVESLERNLEILNINQLLHYIRANTDIGNMHKSLDTINLLNNRLKPEHANKINLLSNILKAEVMIARRDFSQLNSLLNITYEITNRKILADLYFQLGDSLIHTVNFVKALEYYENALELYDLKNHPVEIAKIYLRMSRLSKYKLDYKESFRYLKKVNKIIKATNNKFLKATYYLAYSDMLLLENKLESAMDFTNKALIMHNDIDCVRGQYYSNQYLVKITMQAEKYDQAYKFINKAQSIAVQYKEGHNFYYEDLYRAFIEANGNYQGSLGKINSAWQKAKANNFQIASIYSAYIYNFTKFTYGNDSDKEEGLSNLTSMIDKPAYSLMQKKFKDTLITKKLQPL